MTNSADQTSSLPDSNNAVAWCKDLCILYILHYAAKTVKKPENLLETRIWSHGPDNQQIWTNYSFRHAQKFQRISSKSVNNFLSDRAFK